MIRPVIAADVRVKRALSKLPYPVTKPIRDLMVSLILDAEMDHAVATLVETALASSLATSIVRPPAWRYAM